MIVKRGTGSSRSSRYFIKGKKGQVTIFIIIGIIILFVTAGVIFLTKNDVISDLTTDQPNIASVATEFQPVQEYTQNCLEQIGERGLLILGKQGGYIYPDLVGQYSVTNPTDSDGLNLEPTKVPYWHYNIEPNSATKISLTSLQPALKGDEMSIESQLGRYVNENIAICVDDYAVFSSQGYTFEIKGTRSSTVTVTENSVNFILNYPIEVSLGGSSTSMDTYFVKVPLNLKHYYEIANEITQSQKDYSFLESQSLDLIQSFSSVDTNKLPPTEAVSFELIGTNYWNVPDVKEDLKQVLTSYVPMLQMYGSHNLNHYEYPVTDLSNLYQQNYDNMIIPLTGAEDLEVRFDYFGWELYLDMNDRNGIVTSDNIFVPGKWGIVPPFGTQRYNTVYDVSYPVLVSIDDPLAFDGQGYQFIFSLEANIRNNDRVEANEILPPAISAFSDSIACQDNQRDTKLIRSIVVDSFSKEPIEIVRVGFTIPNQDECLIGVTDNEGVLDESYPAVYGGVVNFIKEDYLTNYYPIDTYPIKDSGALVGYAVAELNEPVIEMHKFKTIDISVKKKKVGKCVTPLSCEYTVGTSILPVIPYKDIECKKSKQQCFFNKGLFDLPKPVASYSAIGSLSQYSDYYFLPGNIESLKEYEEVFLTLNRVKDVNDNVLDDDYSTVVQVVGDTKSEIRLVPGVYEVSGLVTRNKELVIPKDERSMKFPILTVDKEETFTMEESKSEKFITGSLQWDDNDWYGENLYLTITPDDLYTSNELTFYMPTVDFDSIPKEIKTPVKECGGFSCLLGVCLFDGCISKKVSTPAIVMEDQQIMGEIGNISKNVRKDLEPLFT
jgi:hypothetical protein